MSMRVHRDLLDHGIDSRFSYADCTCRKPVHLVLSGHVHQQFDVTRRGVRFIGARSTFRQLRHGGDPRCTDTGEYPRHGSTTSSRTVKSHGFRSRRLKPDLDAAIVGSPERVKVYPNNALWRQHP